MRINQTFLTVLMAFAIPLAAFGQQSLPPVSQFLLIESTASFGQFEIAKEQEIAAALLKHKGPSALKQVSEGGSFFDNRMMVIEISPGHMPAALNALKNISGVAAVPVSDVLNPLTATVAAHSISEITGQSIAANEAGARLQVLQSILNERSKLRRLTPAQLHMATINLYNGIFSIVSTLGNFEKQMAYAAMDVVYKTRPELSYADKVTAARQMVNTAKDVQQTRAQFRETMAQMADVARAMGSAKLELILLTLGGPDSVFSSIRRGRQTRSQVGLGRFFEVIEQEIKQQLELGRRYHELQKRALQAEWQTPGAYAKMMGEGPIEFNRRIIRGRLETRFRLKPNEDFLGEDLFDGGAPAWQSLIEFAIGPNPTQRKVASGRLIMLFADYQTEISKLFAQIRDTEFEEGALEQTADLFKLLPGQRPEALVAKKKISLAKQDGAIKFGDLTVLAQTLDVLSTTATGQVPSASAVKSVAALRLLIAIKSIATSPDLIAKLRQIADDMHQIIETKSLGDLAANDARVAELVKSFVSDKGFGTRNQDGLIVGQAPPPKEPQGHAPVSASTSSSIQAAHGLCEALFGG